MLISLSPFPFILLILLLKKNEEKATGAAEVMKQHFSVDYSKPLGFSPIYCLLVLVRLLHLHLITPWFHLACLILLLMMLMVTFQTKEPTQKPWNTNHILNQGLSWLRVSMSKLCMDLMIVKMED